MAEDLGSLKGSWLDNQEGRHMHKASLSGETLDKVHFVYSIDSAVFYFLSRPYIVSSTFPQVVSLAIDDDSFQESVGADKQSSETPAQSPNLLSVDQLLLSVSFCRIEIYRRLQRFFCLKRKFITTGRFWRRHTTSEGCPCARPTMPRTKKRPTTASRS